MKRYVSKTGIYIKSGLVITIRAQVQAREAKDKIHCCKRCQAMMSSCEFTAYGERCENCWAFFQVGNAKKMADGTYVFHIGKHSSGAYKGTTPRQASSRRNLGSS